jgi:RNA polymerase sigma factor (sigma-70 family)
MEKLIAAARHNSDYDEIFLRHYQQIYQWGMQLTKHNRELSEDLVHEVYMQFTSVTTDFSKVDCFDKYLYVVLRNSYFSHLRRTAHQQNHLTAIELEFVEDPDQINPLDQLELSERLCTICRYACARKKYSISACILLLRFFHGYFPSEITRILNSSRNLVDVALLTARREAIAYLAEQDSSGAFSRKSGPKESAINNLPRSKDINKVFRQIIFSAREGDCLEPEFIKEIYQPGKAVVIRNVLSHIVSCPWCLKEVNELLGLSPLSERHPLDTVDREIVRRKNHLSKAVGTR